MQIGSVPAKFGLTWGANAGGAYIRSVPLSSQIGIQNGAASLNDGFPPDCFTPVGAGGFAPFGQDFNGILNQLSASVQWFQAGASFIYDATFSTNVGGYPKGAVLGNNLGLGVDTVYLNLTDNNTNSPDTAFTSGSQSSLVAENWALCTVAGISTGDIKFRPTAEILPGWIIANATNIGNASSGATQRANADTFALYAWHWNNFSNTQCPVSGGRGATALADFNANKTITVLSMRGTAMMGMDTMQGGTTNLLNNVPITSGSTTTPGSLIGENLHTLIASQIPPLPVTAASGNIINGSTATGNVGAGGTFTVPLNSSFNAVTANSGVTAAGHNTVPFSMLGTVYIKL
jgi:hypothetical protein